MLALGIYNLLVALTLIAEGVGTDPWLILHEAQVGGDRREDVVPLLRLRRPIKTRPICTELLGLGVWVECVVLPKRGSFSRRIWQAVGVVATTLALIT